MTANILLILLYLIGCIHHTFTSIYSLIGLDFSEVKDARLLDIKVHSFRYFTSWNLLLQTAYFYFALTIEIMPLIKNKTIAHLIPIAKISKGTFFSGIMFPSTICVSTLFWTLHFMNSEYVFPPGYEKVIPIWFNHSLHTIILYLAIIEIGLGELYLPGALITFTLAIVYPAVYTIQYYALYYETGRWLYGIMYFLNDTQQILFILFVNMYFVFLAFVDRLIIRRKSNRFVLTEQDQKKLCVRKFL